MVNNGTVILFKWASALSPLEILDCIRTAGDCVVWEQSVYARSLQLVVWMPVYKPRSTLHKHERFVLLHGSHNRVVKCILAHDIRKTLVVIVESRVWIPWDHIQLLCHRSVVETVIELHKVGSYRYFRGEFTEERYLWFHVIVHVPCGKSLPFEVQPHDTEITIFVWRLNLWEAVVWVTPEGGPPCFVQLVYVVVELLCEVILKSFHTETAVALATKLIWHMPHDESRMVSHMGVELTDDIVNFFSVYRWAHAVVLTYTLVFPDIIGIHTPDLRILLCHPCRFAARWRGKNGVNACIIQVVHNILQPVKMVFALNRLICWPWKYTKSSGSHSCLLHQLDILSQDIRAVQPLFSIVITAV